MSFGGNPPRSFPRSELSRINTNLHTTSEGSSAEQELDSAIESARDSRRGGNAYGRRGSGGTSPGSVSSSRFAPSAMASGGGDGYGGSSPVINTADFPSTSNSRRNSPRSSPVPTSRNHSSPFGSRSLRNGMGLSNPIKRAWPRLALWRSRNQLTRVLISVGAAVLFLWLLFGPGAKEVPKERLTTRWWEAGAEKPPSLLPVPSILGAPPPPKPPLLTSHSLAQLSRLPSSFSAFSSPDWTALVHLSSSSQLSLLPSLLHSVLKQSIPPQRILILAPEGFDPNSKPFGPSVGLLSYPTDRPPALAVVLAAGSIATDHLILIDAHVESLAPSYAKTLLRASGTKEYGSALLSTGGLVLPLASSSAATCHLTERLADDLDRTTPLHAPSTPFLLQTTWLAPLSNGLRTDVPIEIALALSLWTKAGIPSFGLPVEAADGKRDWGCERLKRSIVGSERKLGRLFRREAGGGSGLSKATEESSGANASEEPEQETEGVIVVLLSGDEELALAHPLACGFAQEHDVRVFIADSESAAQGPQVFFPSHESSSGGARCHLDIHPLNKPGKASEVTTRLIEELARIGLGRIEVVLYLSDGERGRDFGEVLRWSGAVFGERAGGRRRSKARAEEDGGTVVIELGKAEVGFAEWISTLPMEALRHWHTPKIDLSVITNNRPASLSRLLTALQDAHYFGDDVSLSLNLEQTADRATQHLVDDFEWPFGTVTLRHRIILGGLMPAIVESWYPASNDSYGVFLEDDVEVSPFFYSWLKLSILHYRYYTPMRERSSRLFGVSLYQQKNIELRPEGRQPFDAHALFASLSLAPTLPYLSQIPCSWGAAYFPEVWREFHAYLSLRLSETALSISDSIVPEIRSNRWPRSWKKYFIELVYMRGYVMLYPNYAEFASFSTNHLEKGTHIHVSEVDRKRKEQFTVPLMTRAGSILDLPEGRLPLWDALPIIDLWGAIATDDEVVERGWQSVAQLDTCPPFRLDVAPTYNARELLCPRVYDRTNVLVEAQPLALREERQVPPPLVAHPDAAEVAEEEGGEATGDEDARAFLQAHKQRLREALEESREQSREGSRGGLGEDDEVVEAVEAVPLGQEAYEVEQEPKAGGHWLGV